MLKNWDKKLGNWVKSCHMDSVFDDIWQKKAPNTNARGARVCKLEFLFLSLKEKKMC